MKSVEATEVKALAEAAGGRPFGPGTVVVLAGARLFWKISGEWYEAAWRKDEA